MEVEERAMIESIEFKNFKVLRDCKLPLGPCNILVGPNGSGKSTVLLALQGISDPGCERSPLSIGANPETAKAEVSLNWGEPKPGVAFSQRWTVTFHEGCTTHDAAGQDVRDRVKRLVSAVRVYSFEAPAIAAPVALNPNVQLGPNGGGLAGVLDRLRDHHEERLEAVNTDLRFWLPEFSAVSFDVNEQGQRVFFLRTREGDQAIPAAHLSQGTLLVLAILTLAHLPDPPLLIGLEEPDRGIHPRLLRLVRDALYRLSYPENYGDDREPTQVIATTHSPYFLDQFSEHPEEIVIANRSGDNVQFERLSEQPYMDEILAGARLGDIWYTGILGGVPSEP
jgi:predicted ATPase